MRILLADDESQVRSALRLLLEQELGDSVVGEATRCEELLNLVQLTRPDLLLLDWELPCLRSAMLNSLRAVCPALKVVALGGFLEAACSALDAGADAFISKADPPERLLKIMQMIK